MNRTPVANPLAAHGWGFPGQSHSVANNHDVTVINGDGVAAQVSTVTVGSTTENDVFQITVEGVTVEVVAGDSETTSTIAAALVSELEDALADEPLLAALVTVEQDTADVVITGVTDNVPFDAGTGGDGTLTLATTEGSGGDLCPFGSPVQVDGQTGTCLVGSALGNGGVYGVAVYEDSHEQSGEPYGYPAQTAMAVRRRGQLRVLVDDAVTPGSAVYFDVSEGVYTETSSGNTAIPSTTFVKNLTNVAGQGLGAVIELNI